MMWHLQVAERARESLAGEVHRSAQRIVVVVPWTREMHRGVYACIGLTDVYVPAHLKI
jgi:hypothetical protein